MGTQGSMDAPSMRKEVSMGNLMMETPGLGLESGLCLKSGQSLVSLGKEDAGCNGAEGVASLPSSMEAMEAIATKDPFVGSVTEVKGKGRMDDTLKIKSCITIMDGAAVDLGSAPILKGASPEAPARIGSFSSGLQERLNIALKVLVVLRDCIVLNGHEVPSFWGKIDMRGLNAYNDLKDKPVFRMMADRARSVHGIKQLSEFIRKRKIPSPILLGDGEVLIQGNEGGAQGGGTVEPCLKDKGETLVAASQGMDVDSLKIFIVSLGNKSQISKNTGERGRSVLFRDVEGHQTLPSQLRDVLAETGTMVMGYWLLLWSRLLMWR